MTDPTKNQALLLMARAFEAAALQSQATRAADTRILERVFGQPKRKPEATKK